MLSFLQFLVEKILDTPVEVQFAIGIVQPSGGVLLKKLTRETIAYTMHADIWPNARTYSAHSRFRVRYGGLVFDDEPSKEDWFRAVDACHKRGVFLVSDRYPLA